MKKMFKSAALFMAATITASVIPMGVAAEELTVHGTLKPGYTIVGSYDGNAEISWYRCEESADEGEFLETSNEYRLKNADGGKYIKCVASVDGETISSDTVLIDLPLKKYSRGDAIGGTSKTNAIYKFSIADDDATDYILLDGSADDNSKFFVMTADFFGNHSFDTSGTNALFDPNNKNNVANWLNNTFKTDGVGGKKLPDVILNYIDYNHEWLTDAVKDGDDYLTTCGLSFISADEAVKYAGKYGYNEFNNNRWWTRSTVNLADGRRVPAPMDTNGNIWGTGAGDNTPKVRPVFWLGRDFFKNVALDFDSLGEEVKKMLSATYEKSELESLYSESQLVSMGYAPKPDESLTVSDVLINGTVKPGYTLSGSYTWTNEIAENEDGSIYRWYRCENAEDDGEIIGSGISYTLTNADGGKRIRFEVIPKNENAVFGSSCKSSAIEIDKPITKLSRTDNIGGSSVTNPIYKFTALDDSTTEYILLDVADDSNSKFYVMTSGFFGNRAFDTGNSSVFDPSNEKNIANWLNNTFRTDGIGGKKLPDFILNNIDYTHQWLTDAVVGGNDYLTTCGISLISIDEAIKYAGKYGYNEFNNNRWWTRSSVNLPDGRTVPAPMDTNGKIWGTGATDNTPKIRPVFWLGEDFFKTVAMDIESMGTEVKKAICANYTKADLKNLYTEAQLIEIGFVPEQDDNLTVASVEVSGSLKPGYTLTGNYTWTDSSTEDESIYKWYRCENASDEGELVGNNLTYTLTNADGGKYIRFDVIPKNINLVYGAQCKSSAVLIDNPLAKLNRGDNIGGSNTSDKKCKFSLANDSATEYILLDVSEDNNSKFYVMTADAFGSHTFDTNGSSKFDPSVQANIAYWLNHAFKTEGGADKILPDDILGHIDNNHEWLTDAPMGEDDYLSVCGISLISIDEAIKYAGKYGYNEFNNNRWWTRSSVKIPDGRIVPAPMDTNGNIHGTGATDNTPRVRPVFWLDRDFFKDVKLNLENLADSDVVKVIADNYARDELSGIYSDEELGIFGYDKCGVYDVNIKDKDGNKITKLNGNVKGLNIEAKFASYSSDIHAVMIAALFDKDGGMYAISIDEKDVVKDQSQQFYVDMSNFKIQDNTTMKIMFWDNFLNMTPLVNEINF